MAEGDLQHALIQMVVITTCALAGGGVARRVGITPVIGEIVAGLFLGPTVFGSLLPREFAAVFPAGESRVALEFTAWIGVVFLVLVAGATQHNPTGPGRTRAAVSCAVGAFVVPLILGSVLGFALPKGLAGPNADRAVFAAFVGIALAISAIPVLARLLENLAIRETELGALILRSAVADDTVGWTALSLLLGAVDGDSTVAAALIAIAGVLVFIAFMLSAGRSLLQVVLRFAARLPMRHATTATILLFAVGAGTVTQALGVHLVLGVFLSGLLLNRFAQTSDRVKESLGLIEHLGSALFVPLFFGLSGLKVDLTSLSAQYWLIAVAVIGTAVAGKVLGGFVGGRLGGLTAFDAFVVGVGLNARGAMELLIAAVGLSAGILSAPMYAIVVLVAITTTLMTGLALPRLTEGRPRRPEPV